MVQIRARLLVGSSALASFAILPGGSARKLCNRHKMNEKRPLDKSLQQDNKPAIADGEKPG